MASVGPVIRREMRSRSTPRQAASAAKAGTGSKKQELSGNSTVEPPEETGAHRWTGYLWMVRRQWLRDAGSNANNGANSNRLVGPGIQLAPACPTSRIRPSTTRSARASRAGSAPAINKNGQDDVLQLHTPDRRPKTATAARRSSQSRRSIAGSAAACAGPSAGSAKSDAGSLGSMPGPPTTEVTNQAHSMTSSARSRIDCGTVCPSASAVLRLMTSSNLVGCMTGRSGFSPLRMRPT
jgi:hypothetical protein